MDIASGLSPDYVLTEIKVSLRPQAFLLPAPLPRPEKCVWYEDRVMAQAFLPSVLLLGTKRNRYREGISYCDCRPAIYIYFDLCSLMRL